MLNFYYCNVPVENLEGVHLMYAKVYFGKDNHVDIEYDVEEDTEAYREAIWFDNLTYTW